jgi:hypothetical protein
MTRINRAYIKRLGDLTRSLPPPFERRDCTCQRLSDTGYADPSTKEADAIRASRGSRDGLCN